MVIATRYLPRALGAALLLALGGAPFSPIAAAAQAGSQTLAMVDDVAFGRVAAADVPTPAEPAVDLTVLRQAVEAYRRGNVAEGDRLRTGIEDPAARLLCEWLAIRSGAIVSFERIVRFVREDKSWPIGTQLRRRAEEALLFDRKPPAVVRAFFATQRPISPAGKFALALAFQADGLERDAMALIRETWRKDAFGREFEAKILARFGGALTEADHRARMERMLFKENWDAARRAAALAAKASGKDYGALVKARVAVSEGSKRAGAVLEAVPEALRSDTSYLFSRVQHLRRNNKAAEAAAVIAGAPRDPDLLADGDEWWVERRLVARKLLDDGDAAKAYEVVRHHAAEGAAQRIEAEFHAGWIALRFLDDPASAAVHFRAAARVAETPISVARMAYWQGRAAEAIGAEEVARRHYARAAAHPVTYYGQLALARTGDSLALRQAPELSEAERQAFHRSHAVRAIRLLYKMGAGDLALPLYIDLAHRLGDPAEIDALGDLAAEHRDARALLAVGKTAVQRGLPLDLHAYPTIGIPSFEPVGGRSDKAMVYAIARQESAFDPKAMSHAGARGLMQLMPATAKRTAKRFGIGFNLDKLIDDPSYNAKIGSAHLGELMEDWRGNLILAIASYNAGGGNVKKWIDAYGDPRRPHVDPVDWIERIPFSETRNYVQRVLENLQVYRHRLGEVSALLTESDLGRSGPFRIVEDGRHIATR